jgi:hypothetical protein
MQESTAAIRAGERGKEITENASIEMPSINLEVEDLYLSGEEIVVSAILNGIDDPGVVRARVVDLSSGEVIDEELKSDGSVLSVVLKLGRGNYRIEVRTRRHVPGVGGVADVFEVG